jgi:hypothetical protein
VRQCLILHSGFELGVVEPIEFERKEEEIRRSGSERAGPAQPDGRADPSCTRTRST